MHPFALLLLAALAGDGPGDKEFAYYLSRGRELATQASSSGDRRVGQEAFDAFMAASRIRPKDPVPLAEAGLLALDTGDGPSALKMLDAVYKVAPESGAFHFLRGCLLQARTEYYDAIAEFAAAKEGEFRPSQAALRHFQCTVGLGLQLGEANQYDASVKVLTEAIEMRPNDKLIPIAYYNLGLAHRRLQSMKEAERVFRLCMERFPSYAPTFGELGDMLTELDRFDDAIDVLERSLKADPTYARGWLLMANTQVTRGKFQLAEAAFAQYEKQFPPTGLSEFYRGLYHQKRMEPAKAVERLQRALALDPGMVRAVYYLSLCHRDLGDEEKAKAYMDKWKAVEAENKRKAMEHVKRALEKAGPPPAEAPPAKDGDPK